MYLFADWKQTETGRRSPDIPEGSGFSLLAMPGDNAAFGLFRTKYLSAEALSGHKAEPVSDELDELLQSAEDYPPALAIARAWMTKAKDKTRAEFSDILAAHLSELLAAQPQSPFFLARAIQADEAYKSVGGFYWIVGYTPPPPANARERFPGSRATTSSTTPSSPSSTVTKRCWKRDFPPKARAKEPIRECSFARVNCVYERQGNRGSDQ